MREQRSTAEPMTRSMRYTARLMRVETCYEIDSAGGDRSPGRITHAQRISVGGPPMW